MSMESSAIQVKGVDFTYDSEENLALKKINLDILAKEVTAFIGPSGCGKSTLIRCFNRMNDVVAGARIVSGNIYVLQEDINQPEIDVVDLRRRVGMVFQKSNPFPKSIYENVAYGLRLFGENKDFLDEKVYQSLKEVGLWKEIKDNLEKNALYLSGGQQQRLCIARAIAISPKIILMDEPCSALDPIATAKIEELIFQLREKFTIVIVTHNLQQAMRVSDFTAFLNEGQLIEYGKTSEIFSKPKKDETEAYISGKFG